MKKEILNQSETISGFSFNRDFGVGVCYDFLLVGWKMPGRKTREPEVLRKPVMLLINRFQHHP